MMKTKHAILAVTSIAAAVLAACGGGGGSTTTTASSAGGTAQVQSVAAQVYITDNLATDYSKVWVSIKKITALDSSGNEITLLDSTATPAVVNLSSLASVGQFMSAVTIPAGIYTEVRVTLDNNVQLVSLDGSTTTNAKFGATASDLVWRITNVSLDATAGGQIVLDFNLAKFTYDATSGLVSPVVELPDPATAFGKFVSQKAELNASVVSVDAIKNTVTVNDPHLGNGVIVSLATDAVIMDETTGAVLTLGGLTQGQTVEIKGVVTPGATSADPVTVVASLIHVEPPAKAAPPAGSASGSSGAPVTQPTNVVTARGEGKVSLVSGSLVSVAIDEANFLPGSNTVVVDISTAKFAHGQANDVVAGATVDFGGAISGFGASAKVVALVFDVQGAQSDADRKANPGQAFSGVNGPVATINADGTFMITVTKADGPLVVPGTYTVNPGGATYTEGKASCLVVGATVQAVGSLSGTNLAAKFLNIPGCGGQPRAAAPKPPAAPPPGPVASAPGSGASGPSGGASAPAGGASAPTTNAGAPGAGASTPAPTPKPIPQPPSFQDPVPPVPSPIASAPAADASAPNAKVPAPGSGASAPTTSASAPH